MSPWAIGDRVHIDEDQSLTGRVTGLSWRQCEGHTVEVAWMHNGSSQVAWFAPWRLSAAAVAGDARKKGA